MFKKHMVPLTPKGQTIKHQGKGAVEETLPHRDAIPTITDGDPADRMMNQYAKGGQVGDDARPNPLFGD